MKRFSAYLLFGLLAVGSLTGCPAAKPCIIDTDCPSEARCLEGQCKSSPQCEAGETGMRGRCFPTSCGDHPCHSGQVCIDSVCVDDQCIDTVCGRGEECVRGTCFPDTCAGKACNEGDVCEKDRCVFAGCVGKECDRGEECADGRCLPKLCNGAVCADGAVCENDRCVDKSCVGITCPDDQTCSAGICFERFCGDVVCAEGRACIDGECIATDCRGLSCGSTARCVNATCVACEQSESVCSNGQDDDCDGKDDCEDPDCINDACNDGNRCTTADKCVAGTCTGTPKACNSPTGQCRQSGGTCDPETGECAYPPKTVGTTCNANNLCTVDDACDEAGNCVGGSIVACVSPPNDCYQAVGSCNSADGRCTYGFKPAGATCNVPGNCISGGTCDGAGKCTGGTPNKCDSPPSACFGSNGTCQAGVGCVYPPLPAGSSCNDNNLCTGSAQSPDACNGGGLCISGARKVCNTPPGQCRAAIGTCNPSNGNCSYPAAAAGTACNDGNGCTADKCNEAGQCVPGTACPNTNPCQTVRCVNNACVATTDPNGSSCGAAASMRCCGGACVNISNDERNCGGCGLGCVTGRNCQTVSSTTGCSSRPVNTAGRCGCAEDRNCPKYPSQICRADQPQYNALCTPVGTAGCSANGKFTDLAQCPNYCSY